MKKNIGIYSAIVLFSLGISLAAFGQPDKIAMMGRTPVYHGDRNHQIAVLESDFPKVARKFTDKFPGAANTLWIKNDKILLAYFLHKGNKVSAAFNREGKLIYCITKLDPLSVPEYIKNKTEDVNPSYKIFSIKEIMNNGIVMHEIIIENNNEFKVIQLETEEITEIRKIKK